MRCLLVVGVLTLWVGCSRGQPKDGPGGAETPDLRIAVVTDLDGYLEPCGCTSNPLGGIDRLAAQIRSLREGSVPVFFLIAGDVFFDTADLEPARVDQANRNATTLAAILNRLDVTAVLPGRRDRAQPSAVLDALRAASAFPWLAMKTEVEVLRTDAGALRLAVVGVRPGADRDAVRAAIAAAEADTELTIALVDGSRREANRIGAIEGVDFVIEGGLDEDQAIPPREAGKAWVLHAGRQGRGVTVVDVYRKKKVGQFVDRSEWSRSERATQLDQQIAALSAKIAAWERSSDVDPTDLEAQRERLAHLAKARRALDAPAMQAVGNAFAAHWVPLPKQAPKDEQVAKLMREHDKVVNEANRIALSDLEPLALGPEDIAYVGSAACSGCHQAAYAWWRSHAHGHAYLTLQERNKEFNLDCVGCHVTGYGKPGGSTVTHNLNGALVNVGCESCHGPGAAHAKNPEVGILRNTPESTCMTCHNTQHSDLFDYAAYLKTIVVPGHGLPEIGR
ncbi:MAG: multiheme c-type cytochrome [Myxococcales bacterium]|nr:multiheme c-type cytochrome [Myxococcales bacterium]